MLPRGGRSSPRNPPGYYYTRIGNPNLTALARKIAVLEGLDLLRTHPDADLDRVVDGRVFPSGMAAVSAVILSCLGAGDSPSSLRATCTATPSPGSPTWPHAWEFGSSG